MPRRCTRRPLAHNGYYVVSAYTGPDPDPVQENTFLIKTEQDLRWVAEHLADYQTATLIQTADIDLGGETFPAIGANNAKDTLGSSYASFKDIAFQGTYDGQNHAITGVVVEDADYGGFFGSVCEATIKNMKMGIVNGGVSDNKECVALFVGVAAKSTLRNLTTIKGTDEGTTAFTSGKDGGGIVAYMAGGTLDSCTNNLDIVFSTNLDNRKGGGIAIITQAGKSDATKVTIKDCVNNGNVSTQKTASNGIGGIVGLVSLETEFDGCVNNGTVSAGSGSWIGDIGGLCSGKATVANMTPKATMLTFGRTASAGNTDGALFAKDGAFVANANVAAGDPAPTYVVMSGMTNDYTFAFSEAGAIAFDQSLFALPKLNVTGPTGYTVTPETSGNVTTYTCAAIPVSSVTISGEKEVKVGETITLTATVLPPEAPYTTVTWKSSNDSLATVTDAGVVTGVAAGKVTITATAGGVDGTYEVEVKTAGGWDPTADDSKTAADVPGIPEALKVVSLKQISVWAQGAGAAGGDEVKPEDVIVEAFLLNCANNPSVVAAEKAKFKFTEFDPANPPTADAFASKGYNGTVQVKSFSDAACTTEASTGDQLFYRAFLVPTPAPVKEN